MIIFTWDENKNRINTIKHGITFLEAKSVFIDDDAILLDDDLHSNEEERNILIGLSSKGNLLVVVFTYKTDDLIRIISARKSTKNETKEYYRRKSLWMMK